MANPCGENMNVLEPLHPQATTFFSRWILFKIIPAFHVEYKIPCNWD